MADYKTVISTLCKLINSMCDLNVKPEQFRLTKYNKTENNVVPMFWSILHKFNPLCGNENIIQNAKLYLATSHYKSVEFYCLPENMTYGSRDLLLAFSWLLAQNDIIERKLQLILYKSKIKEEFESNEEKNMKELGTHIELNNIEDYHNYLLWAVGQINQNMKIIKEYSNKTADIVTQVDKEKTSVLTTSQLTIAEILLTKNTEKIQKYIIELKNIYIILENYLKWKTMEKHYWNWMKTVMAENSKNLKKKIDLTVGNNFFKYLKCYIKQNLNSEAMQIQLSQNNFPGSLAFSRSISGSETNSTDLHKDQNISQNEKEYVTYNMTIENNKNIDKIYQYLNVFMTKTLNS